MPSLANIVDDDTRFFYQPKLADDKSRVTRGIVVMQHEFVLPLFRQFSTHVVSQAFRQVIVVFRVHCCVYGHELSSNRSNYSFNIDENDQYELTVYFN